MRNRAASAERVAASYSSYTDQVRRAATGPKKVLHQFDGGSDGSNCRLQASS